MSEPDAAAAWDDMRHFSSAVRMAIRLFVAQESKRVVIDDGDAHGRGAMRGVPPAPPRRSDLAGARADADTGGREPDR